MRFATWEDVDGVVALGREMFVRSRFERLSFDWAKSRQLAQHAVDHPAYMLGIAESSTGDLAGFHMANVDRYIFCDDLVGQSIAYFVLPRYRGTSAAVRLLQLFWRWAEKRGAREIVLGTGISAGASLQAMDHFVRRVGLQQVGGLYGRWLEEIERPTPSGHSNQ